MVSRQIKSRESKRRRSASRERGSLMILVVTVLVLAAILGVSYLQVARLDRIATSQMESGNIDTVARAVVHYIGQVLTNDLIYVDPDTDAVTFFDPAHGDEPYDYAWTNDVDVSPVDGNPDYTFDVRMINGVVQQATGGTNDDTWLASSEPADLATMAPYWPHITNLNGIFLEDRQTANTADFTTIPARSVPIENLVTNGGGTSDDSAIPVLVSTNPNPLLADADGDGIGDSSWTWAPIKQISGVLYVMAVRIIDNSAMVNANVALSQVDSSGAYDSFNDASTGTNHAPRWWFPSELDLGRFVWQTSGDQGLPAAAIMSNELQPLLDYRLGGTLASPLVEWYLDAATSEVRYFYWLLGPSMYGNFNGDTASYGFASAFENLDIRNELELRYKNGLNNDEVDATIEGLMPTFLRSASSESTYTDFTGLPANAANIQAYFLNNPRLGMTVRSGAAIYAPPRPGETNCVLKQDLNYLVNLFMPPTLDPTASIAPDATRLGDLSTEIANVVNVGGSFSAPMGLTNDDFANQFAANIRDYADTDNTLTELNGRFGMEALPFITEVYRQRAYVAAWQLIDDNGTPVTTDDNFGQFWAQTGNTGYAIELRNPFRRTISLAGVYISFDGGTTTTELSTLPNSQTEMAVDEVIILYRNPGGTAHNLLDSEPNLITVTPPETVTTCDILTATDHPNVEGAAVATIELSVATTDIATNPQVVYQKVKIEPIDDSTLATTEIPGSLVQHDSSLGTDPPSPPAPALPSPNEAYKQVSHFGNGNGLNMMTVIENAFKLAFAANPNPSNGLPTATYDATNFSALGEPDKTPYGGPGGDPTTVLTTQQIVISDYGVVRHVGELAHIASIGPDPSNTIADLWSGTTNIADFMLEFQTNNVMSSTTDYLAVPHAVFLLSRFTTLSPATDGLDNDNDGTADEGDELLVPGTVNLNTAPAHLLKKILPIPDATIRGNMVDAIVAYRDKTGLFGGDNRNGGTYPIQIASYRTNRGIATIGELMEVVDRNDPSTITGLDYLGRDSSDNRKLPAGASGVVVDFMTPTSTTPDDVTDDREETTMVPRWLGQVCSTRSDIFTAYVLIRGYEIRDYSTVLEQRHFFVIYDRSRVTADTPAQILAIYEYN